LLKGKLGGDRRAQEEWKGKDGGEKGSLMTRES
jgi:hypothetical protein